MACRDSKGRFISEKKKAQLEKAKTNYELKRAAQRKLEADENETSSKKRITEMDYVNELLNDVVTSTECISSKNAPSADKTKKNIEKDDILIIGNLSQG